MKTRHDLIELYHDFLCKAAGVEEETEDNFEVVDKARDAYDEIYKDNKLALLAKRHCYAQVSAETALFSYMVNAHNDDIYLDEAKSIVYSDPLIKTYFDELCEDYPAYKLENWEWAV